MWLSWTWLQFGPTTKKLGVCGKLVYEANSLSRSWYKESWRVADKGWHKYEWDSRLELWPPWWREKLVFTIGFMSHSGISFIWFESWPEEGGWEDGLGIWCAYFPTLWSSHGDINVGIEKGGGQGAKWIVGSSSKIRGVS